MPDLQEGTNDFEIIVADSQVGEVSHGDATTQSPHWLRESGILTLLGTPHYMVRVNGFLFKAAFVKPKGRSFQVVLVIVVTPRTSGPPNRPSKTICFISLCFALTFSPGSCPVSTALCCWILSTSRRVECLA